MGLHLDGHGDATGPDRRLAESHHLALAMEPGPVRSALLAATSDGAYAALAAALAAAQAGLAAARDRNFEGALGHLETAGAEAREASRLRWAVDRPAVDGGQAGTTPLAGPSAARRTLGSLKGWRPGEAT